MLSFLPPLLRLLAVFGVALSSFAAAPFLRPHDVIAFVGGEDMVALSEYGYLELLLVCALPDHQLRFRNLAWEGDTVFEQRRDLNFPSLEAQLDKIGATVVIAQFGQMESLAGKEKLPEFIAAYEKLIERISGGGKRKLLLLGPTPPAVLRDRWPEGDLEMLYEEAVGNVAAENKVMVFALSLALKQASTKPEDVGRDGFHLSTIGQYDVAQSFIHTGSIVPHPTWLKESGLLNDDGFFLPVDPLTGAVAAPQFERLRQLIVAKNRLWFHYWRPQNWAFLNGDRINQPSSRDHLDPSKRWFPEEIEQFIPLIEAKEREIDALAAQLAKP